jgi:hypothetical protein
MLSPSTSLLLKYFMASASVNTRLWGSENTRSVFPFKSLKSKNEKKFESAYIKSVSAYFSAPIVTLRLLGLNNLIDEVTPGISRAATSPTPGLVWAMATS